MDISLDQGGGYFAETDQEMKSSGLGHQTKVNHTEFLLAENSERESEGL